MLTLARSLALGALIGMIAACTPPASQEAPQAAPEETADDAGASTSAGIVRAAMNGGAASEMTAGECVIVNNGANGVVRAGDGDFELSWADGVFRVVWSSGGGLYVGDVNGAVAGQTITFDGASDGATVSGSATCT